MIFLAGLLVAAMATGAPTGQERALTRSEIAQILAEIASGSEVPQQVDPATRLVQVTASGLNLIYYYELNEYGTVEQLRKFFFERNLPGLCADEDVIHAFEQGVTFTYNYKMLAVNEPVSLVIGLAECTSSNN